MKTYVITLERSIERYRYIKKHVIERLLDYEIIPAVDGSKLKEDDLIKLTDYEKVKRLRWWLTDGAIGCALSHLNAYQAFLNTNDNAAFIIEDDVNLPADINNLLFEIEKVVRPDEIILLYYTSFKPTKFSTVGSVKLSKGGLYYPMDIGEPISAAAYTIGKEAALNLKNKILPIRVTADNWSYFYEISAFSTLRVHFPAQINTKNFKSSIDYLPKNSFKSKISNFVNRYKIFPLFQIFNYLRKKRLNKMLYHFSLCDEISPTYKKLNP
jgi:glycosyl transferase family 25